MALPAFPADLPAPERFAPPSGVQARPVALGDYADFEEITQAADREGILDVPAEDPVAAREGKANLVREGVIAERLWLLGYLQHRDDIASSDDPDRRERFLAAVEAFQVAAGLVADRWSGEKTWHALDELVTFETTTPIARYFRTDGPLPALVRAVRLRLWALGILDSKPSPDGATNSVPEEALKAFWVLNKRFRLAKPEAPQPALHQLLEKLFDQDRLLKAVAESGRKASVGGRQRWVFSYLKWSAERRTETDPEVESFLASLAKIELWLLGFDVDIAARRDYPVYLFRNRTDRRSSKLKAALERFWSELGTRESLRYDGNSRVRRRQRRDRDRLNDFVTPELFKVLSEPDFTAEPGAPESSLVKRLKRPIKTDDYSREVARELDTQDKIDAAWSQGKNLGMKLWDGLKRIWRWIWRGVTKILRIGKNMGRALFRYSSKAYKIAKRMLRTVTQSLVQYVGGRISTGTDIKVLLSSDGDIQVVIPRNILHGQARLAREHVEYYGAAFRIACEILGIILRTLSSVVIGAVGWARLLWMLVQSYRDIRPLYAALRALPEPGTA